MRATQIEGTTSDSKMNVIEIYEAILFFFLFFLFFLTKICGKSIKSLVKNVKVTLRGLRFFFIKTNHLFRMNIGVSHGGS